MGTVAVEPSHRHQNFAQLEGVDVAPGLWPPVAEDNLPLPTLDVDRDPRPEVPAERQLEVESDVGAPV
eukprot:6168045-Lingulodinium_polyedra.AAC.1